VANSFGKWEKVTDDEHLDQPLSPYLDDYPPEAWEKYDSYDDIDKERFLRGLLPRNYENMIRKALAYGCYMVGTGIDKKTRKMYTIDYIFGKTYRRP